MTSTTWTESELAEVDRLCQTLPLNEAWSIVANDKLQVLQVMGEETMFKLVTAEKRVAELEAKLKEIADLRYEEWRSLTGYGPSRPATGVGEEPSVGLHIMNKTIERCAQVAEQSGGFPTYYVDAEKVAAAIRAQNDVSAASPPGK